MRLREGLKEMLMGLTPEGVDDQMELAVEVGPSNLDLIRWSTLKGRLRVQMQNQGMDPDNREELMEEYAEVIMEFATPKRLESLKEQLKENGKLEPE